MRDIDQECPCNNTGAVEWTVVPYKKHLGIEFAIERCDGCDSVYIDATRTRLRLG